MPLAQTMSIKRFEELATINTARAALIQTARLRGLIEPLQTIAAIAETSPAKSMAFGAPNQLSSGTTARQASAPPQRSAPYRLGIRDDSREKITENCSPVRKKGTAEHK